MTSLAECKRKPIPDLPNFRSRGSIIPVALHRTRQPSPFLASEGPYPRVPEIHRPPEVVHAGLVHRRKAYSRLANRTNCLAGHLITGRKTMYNCFRNRMRIIVSVGYGGLPSDARRPSRCLVNSRRPCPEIDMRLDIRQRGAQLVELFPVRIGSERFRRGRETF